MIKPSKVQDPASRTCTLWILSKVWIVASNQAASEEYVINKRGSPYTIQRICIHIYIYIYVPSTSSSSLLPSSEAPPCQHGRLWSLRCIPPLTLTPDCFFRHMTCQSGALSAQCNQSPPNLSLEPQTTAHRSVSGIRSFSQIPNSCCRTNWRTPAAVPMNSTTP